MSRHPSILCTRANNLPQKLTKYKVIVDNGKPIKEVFRARSKFKCSQKTSKYEEAKDVNTGHKSNENSIRTTLRNDRGDWDRLKSRGSEIIRRCKSKVGMKFEGIMSVAERPLRVSSRLIIRSPDDVPEKPVFALSPLRWINESTYLIESNKKGDKYKQRLELLMKPYAHRVLFQDSIYPNRPSTVFFQYPPSAHKQRLQIRVKAVKQEELGDCYLGFRVSDNTCAYKCVCKALKYAGFRIVKGGSWNILWSAPSRNEIVAPMHSLQKINHFPGIMQIGRKDNLCRNINRLKRIHGKEYFICPPTYILPEDLPRFQREKDVIGDQIWIMKPQASSCGRGIWLLGPNTTFLSKEYLW